MTVPAADDRELAGYNLRRLADNRQMPDANRMTITLGELRAALAGVSPSTGDDRLRAEAERIVGNGPAWARQYAFQTLEAALRAATPAPKPENPR